MMMSQLNWFVRDNIWKRAVQIIVVNASDLKVKKRTAFNKVSRASCTL